MRENNGLIEFQGKLYLFGGTTPLRECIPLCIRRGTGYNGQQWLNDLFSFDLITKEWHNVDQSGNPPPLLISANLANA